jgi:hypothetical protein
MVPYTALYGNGESCDALLRELILDPSPHCRKRVKRLPAGVDTGQPMKAFEVLDDMMAVGGLAHVGDSQKVHQLCLGHELREPKPIEFFVHKRISQVVMLVVAAWSRAWRERPLSSIPSTEYPFVSTRSRRLLGKLSAEL